MRMFTIKVKATYNEDTVPYDMETQLKDNVARCIERAELLNDSNLEAVIEDYDIRVRGEY
jgi:hypothetical protein